MKMVVCGGTGSLGQVLVRRLLVGELGLNCEIVVFSRDEAKQHAMRLAYLHRPVATDEVIYDAAQKQLRFEIGDVRDLARVQQVIAGASAVFYAAALKQVPTCEYFPLEAIRTNVLGASNVIEASGRAKVGICLGVSTDKACLPINVMGMTKALQERLLIEAALRYSDTRFVGVRYGNVLASRGSVLPLFLEQIAKGGPITLTDDKMTRFFLSLDDAVDTIFAAYRGASPGDIYVPACASARLLDVVWCLIDPAQAIEIKMIGIRPGEKVHEVLVSAEEAPRTFPRRGSGCVIHPMLPELNVGRRWMGAPPAALLGAYSSAEGNLTGDALRGFLTKHRFLEAA